MLIRPLHTMDDCRSVAALERAIWGYRDPEEVIPPGIVLVSLKRGGLLLGAFAGEAMVGYTYAVPSVKEGRQALWSHALGVVEGARGQGAGAALKAAQRQHALRMGIDLIEWTADPLQAAAAHLNFARLGAVVEEYEENLYGASSSALHGGAPTDRFVIEWHLSTPHVERRLAAGGPKGDSEGRRRKAARPIGVRDGAVVSAVLVNPAHAEGEWLVPGDPDLEVEGSRVLVEIPPRFTAMLCERPDLALEWRLSTRRAFQAYLARGYRVVDFFLSRERGGGQYLLARAAS